MHFPSSRPLRVVVLAALSIAVVPLAHCSSDTPTTPPSAAVIGPTGGALASADYAIEILIPPGALATNATFTITPVSAPGSGSLAPAYTITSDGATTFLSPVVISYTEQAITGQTFHDASDYRVAAFDPNASWAALANPTVDALANTIQGTTTALSNGAYSVIIPAKGNACVNLTTTCAAGTVASDAGCVPATCDPVLPGKCAAYPGAVAQSCAGADAGTGINVECCFPAGEPSCFLQTEPSGCENPCSQLPGSSAEACIPDIGPPLTIGSNGGVSQSTCCFAPGAPICVASHTTGNPAPRCAAGGGCAGVPGTTATGCVDVSDGTEATCCYPAGTVPNMLPPPAAAGDGGVVVPVDSGADANGSADANGGTDANGNSDANGNTDANENTDANGTQDANVQPDASGDAGDEGGIADAGTEAG